MNRFHLTLLAAILLASCSGGVKTVNAQLDTQLKSPDGRLEASFGLTDDGIPVYALNFDGKAVIKPSRLGYRLMDGRDLQKDFKLEGTETSAFDETWSPYGAKKRRSATITTSCW